MKQTQSGSNSTSADPASDNSTPIKSLNLKQNSMGAENEFTKLLSGLQKSKEELEVEKKWCDTVAIGFATLGNVATQFMATEQLSKKRKRVHNDEEDESVEILTARLNHARALKQANGDKDSVIVLEARLALKETIDASNNNN